MKHRIPRDVNGRFIVKEEHELRYLRTNKGRKKAGICNCCKLASIERHRLYCDNCKDWIQSIRTKQQTQIQNLKERVKRYKDILNNHNPGNIIQILQSFKKYKSSADHYRNKCERILTAYNELVTQTSIETFTFKMQVNTIVLKAPGKQTDVVEPLLEKPIEC